MWNNQQGTDKALFEYIPFKSKKQTHHSKLLGTGLEDGVMTMVPGVSIAMFTWGLLVGGATVSQTIDAIHSYGWSTFSMAGTD